MVVNRLKWYLEFYSLLNYVQSGFCHRRKTTDHIMHLHDIVTKSLANKHHVLAVFIDIEKAYDKVSKDALLLKLLKTGINGNMFSFIRSFLSNQSFQVRVGSSLSQTKYPANGIPQGSILCPVLFSILINDLPSGIRTRTALHADMQLHYICCMQTSRFGRVDRVSDNKWLVPTIFYESNKMVW